MMSCFSCSGAIHTQKCFFFLLNWFNLCVIVAKITYVSTFLSIHQASSLHSRVYGKQFTLSPQLSGSYHIAVMSLNF